MGASFAGIACNHGVKGVGSMHVHLPFSLPPQLPRLCEEEEQTKDSNGERNDVSNQQSKRLKSREAGVPNVEKIFQSI